MRSGKKPVILQSKTEHLLDPVVGNMACRTYSSFLLFVVCSFVISTQGLSWDRLAVTFGKFTRQPLTIADAEKAGWTQDGWCEGRRSKLNFYRGNRFTHNGDKATRLLYDCDGHIAGIQATITRSETYPSQHQTPPWIAEKGGMYSITAYFRDPEEICKCKKKCKDRIAKKPRVGDGLWIQIDKIKRRSRVRSKVMEIPLHVSGLEGSPWVKGTCIGAMGTHYHYNISVDLDCDYAFPVFLLYEQTSHEMNGFGWGASLSVDSDTWEKPDPTLFTRSMQKEVIPTCLQKLSVISVQHIYFVAPLHLC